MRMKTDLRSHHSHSFDQSVVPAGAQFLFDIVSADRLTAAYDSMPPRKDAFAEILDYYEWLINMSSDGKSNDCVLLDEIDEAEDMDRVLQFDADLKALIVEHQTFLEDMIRVQKEFVPFLEHVHHRNEFL